MTRFALTLALALLASSPALAQDMPLSQILIDGEGWKKVANPAPKPGGGPVVTSSPDGGTAFRWRPESGRFIEARQAAAGAQPFAPYCPLRVKRGQKSIEVTGLATDRDGRIYAATAIGVQVFDPTGRLCGVLAPPAPGKPERLSFEGDQLTLWIGEAKYARRLNTQGASAGGKGRTPE